MKHIWVVGGDPRQAALAAALEEDGHVVHTFALGQGEDTLAGIDRADCVILPLPSVTGEGLLHAPLCNGRYPMEDILDALRSGQPVFAGMADERLRRLTEERGLPLYDYFAREELTVRNAVPTAEGAIRIALSELPITLHGARVLLVGFGRLSRALAPRLQGLGARVCAAARSSHQRALAESMGLDTEGLDRLPDWLCVYDLVINTVPALVLGEKELAAMKEGVLVIDLASRPGGVDFAAAEQLGVKAIHALSLPGKEAPVTAGRYIRDTVYHMMEELGV